MPRQYSSQSAQSSKTAAMRLTDEQIGKLADLVAEGRYQYPGDLHPEDDGRFQVQVRRRLRERLLRLIARAIVRHLRCDPGQLSEDLDHVGA